jgi:hypothetical protein
VAWAHGGHPGCLADRKFNSGLAVAIFGEATRPAVLIVAGHAYLTWTQPISGIMMFAKVAVAFCVQPAFHGSTELAADRPRTSLRILSMVFDIAMLSLSGMTALSTAPLSTQFRTSSAS